MISEILNERFLIIIKLIYLYNEKNLISKNDLKSELSFGLVFIVDFSVYGNYE